MPLSGGGSRRAAHGDCCNGGQTLSSPPDCHKPRLRSQSRSQAPLQLITIIKSYYALFLPLPAPFLLPSFFPFFFFLTNIHIC